MAAYANRLDGKLPEATVETVLTYAKTLAGRKNPSSQGIASLYVHLATSDAASLAAGLKRCGLEGVKPAVCFDPNGGGRADPETLHALMRVALLHPVASEPLLESLGTPQASDPATNMMLTHLQEPKLRAKISPALFLKWNFNLQYVRPQHLEIINLYASERRGDFDEAQRTQLDGLLKRLQESLKPMDPDRVRQLQEEWLRWNQQLNLKPKTQPR